MIANEPPDLFKDRYTQISLDLFNFYNPAKPHRCNEPEINGNFQISLFCRNRLHFCITYSCMSAAIAGIKR